MLLVKKGWLKQRKVKEMPEVAPIRDLKGYLEPEQVERLVDTAANPRNRLLVRIPWRTGIRVSELITIRVQDIDFDSRAILIKVQKIQKRDGKTIERRRVIPVDQSTLDMVKEYLKWGKQFPYKGDLLFLITRQRVDQIFWKLGRKAGIKEIGDPAVSKHRKLHPHHLSHSFVTSAAAVGSGTNCPGLLALFDHAASISKSHVSDTADSTGNIALGSTLSIVMSPGPLGLIIFSHGYASRNFMRIE